MIRWFCRACWRSGEIFFADDRDDAMAQAQGMHLRAINEAMKWGQGYCKPDLQIPPIEGLVKPKAKLATPELF